MRLQGTTSPAAAVPRRPSRPRRRTV